MKKLQQLMQDKLFWIVLILVGVAFEGIAFYYQYYMDEPPCVLCIHFRLLVVLLIFFAFIGLLVRSTKTGLITASLLLFFTFSGMLERSYQLLGTERRFIDGDCAFTLNFPDWIAVDKWMPSFFMPMTSCGYTPKLLFNITMAELLSVFSVLMLLFSVAMLVASFRRR